DACYTKRIRWPAGFDPQAAGAWLVGQERPDVAALYGEALGNVPRSFVWQGSPNLSWHFGSSFARPSDVERLGIRVCPSLSDWLEVGPQHVDLTLQTQLRERYFRDSDMSPCQRRDLECLDAYAQALATGEEVAFWCDPQLKSCLAILWALDALHQ